MDAATGRHVASDALDFADLTGSSNSATATSSRCCIFDRPGTQAGGVTVYHPCAGRSKQPPVAAVAEMARCLDPAY